MKRFSTYFGLSLLMLAGCGGSSGGGEPIDDGNGPAVVLAFDDLDSVSSIAGTDVAPAARLSDQYLTSNGIRFSSGANYVAVVSLPLDDAPTRPNGIAGASAAGKVSYAQSNAITFTFWDRSDTSKPGLTRSVSVATDNDGVPSQTLTLTAYDADGEIIGTDSKSDTGGETLTVAFDSPRIHKAVFRGSVSDSNGVALDNVTFKPVVKKR